MTLLYSQLKYLYNLSTTMGIKIIKDYQFADDDDEIEEHIMSEDNSDLDIQRGSYELGYGRELQWRLHLEANIIDLSFVKTFEISKTEVRTLNSENPIARFSNYRRPYSRVAIEVEAMFDDKKLVLNGVRCGRREPSARWACSQYDNVILTTW